MEKGKKGGGEIVREYKEEGEEAGGGKGRREGRGRVKERRKR